MTTERTPRTDPNAIAVVCFSPPPEETEGISESAADAPAVAVLCTRFCDVGLALSVVVPVSDVGVAVTIAKGLSVIVAVSVAEMLARVAVPFTWPLANGFAFSSSSSSSLDSSSPSESLSPSSPLSSLEVSSPSNDNSGSSGF